MLNGPLTPASPSIRSSTLTLTSRRFVTTPASKRLRREPSAPRGRAPQAEYKQFDFWVGEWDVSVSGQPAGTNSVQRVEDGCIIFENWTGAGGGSGKSFNFHDSSMRKWRQVWVSSNGGVLDFFGEYADGQMRYTGETQGPTGTKVMQRLTFFNLSPDRVRQFWEQSTDGGKTWNTVFDGLYVRKK